MRFEVAIAGAQLGIPHVALLAREGFTRHKTCGSGSAVKEKVA